MSTAVSPTATPQLQGASLSGLLGEARARHAGALRLAALLGILLFAFWMGMAPHWSYPYPLHVDEWFGLSYAQEMLQTGRLQYPSPYERSLISYPPEIGFHLIWGFLGAATGRPLLDLYRVAPGVQLALLALFTYALGRRSGFGWAAALFVPLIPTSLWTLGPGFVVPVTVAALFIPLLLLPSRAMLSTARGESLWVLLVLLGGTLFVHPTTEGVATVLVVLYVGSFLMEALLGKRFREGARLVVTLGLRLLVPVIVLGFWMPSLSRSVLHQSTLGLQDAPTPLGLQQDFVWAFGVQAAAVGIIGMALFLFRSDSILRSWVLPAVTVGLGAFLYLHPRYFLGPAPLYNRAWTHLGLFLAIFVGYAVASYFHLIPTAARLLASWLGGRARLWAGPLLACGGVALIVFVFTTGLFGNHRRQFYARYYHLVNGAVATDYAWLGQRLGPERWVASGEAGMGWAYPLLGGPGRRAFGPDAEPFLTSDGQKLRAMVTSAQVDVGWLREKRVEVFYTCDPLGQCRELPTPGLFKVRQGVYYLPSGSPTK